MRRDMDLVRDILMVNKAKGAAARVAKQREAVVPNNSEKQKETS